MSQFKLEAKKNFKWFPWYLQTLKAVSSADQANDSSVQVICNRFDPVIECFANQKELSFRFEMN